MDDSGMRAGTRQDETKESENIRNRQELKQHNKAATPTPRGDMRKGHSHQMKDLSVPKLGTLGTIKQTRMCCPVT